MVEKDNGFVVIRRKMLDWGWYTNVKTKTLFLHCILKANWEEKEWQGIKIKRGQFVTSLSKLAIETGLTVDEVRTALKHLNFTNEITSAGTSKNTVITVKNYDSYQVVPKRFTKQNPNKSQTVPKPLPNNSQQLMNYNELLTINNELERNKEQSSSWNDEYINGGEPLPPDFWEVVGGYEE